MTGDLGFATVDVDRERRQGLPEVVYGPGKTPEQIAQIVHVLLETATGPVLVTRVEAGCAAAVQDRVPGGEYHKVARILTWRPAVPGGFSLGIVTAGTSDGPVAEEAAVTARTIGLRVDEFTDVGVAGVHRLLSRVEEIRACDAVIVVAGMEGALASVVGGLVAVPVIAVPTSTGYGAALEGVTALLAMLSSCAAGVTVVNIDAGFSAAIAAFRLARAGSRDPSGRPNVLPALLGAATGDDGRTDGVGSEGGHEPMVCLQTTVDDVTGELIGYLTSALLDAGAADVWTVPGTGKKSRPVHVITVLSHPGEAEDLCRLLMAETGSLGVRRTLVDRYAAPRRTIEVRVAGQRVRIKCGPHRMKPEYDDLVAVARVTGLPLRTVAEQALAAVPPS